MRRMPARPNRARQSVVSSASMPAPVGGWNARDPWQNMAETDAIILDNIFPETSSVCWRKGHESRVTDFGSAVESLMAWTGPTSNKLKAASGTAIYDATSAGSVGAAEVSSLTNARWQHTNFETSAGHYLVIANGADSVRHYDGSSWAAPSITNVTSSTLIHVNAHKRRLWFVEKDSLSAWFLPVDAIAGAATELNLGPLCRLGGHLLASATWTRDGGDGLDDLAVFITSEGEVVIYQGTDPSSASTWSLIGVFRIGRPMGRRCALQLGGDVYIVTQDGIGPLSDILPSGRSSKHALVSDKIRDAVTVATREYIDNFGWQPIFYPTGNFALVNVPISSAESHQYVVNTTTGSWCRFTGMNAQCWEVLDNNLYFGGATAVFQADSGLDDNGTNIKGTAKQAYSYLRRPGILKRFTQTRPIFETEGSIDWAMRASVDFDSIEPQDTSSYTGPAPSLWDVADWDTSAWTVSPIIQRDWRGVDGVGYAAALHAVASIKDFSCRWYSTDWLFESGGYL